MPLLGGWERGGMHRGDDSSVEVQCRFNARNPCMVGLVIVQQITSGKKNRGCGELIIGWQVLTVEGNPLTRAQSSITGQKAFMFSKNHDLFAPSGTGLLVCMAILVTNPWGQSMQERQPQIRSQHHNSSQNNLSSYVRFWDKFLVKNRYLKDRTN
jgi:hypothetical protein